MPVPARAIIVRPDALGGLYEVEVLPPFTDGPCHDQAFANIKAARGYASGLKMVTGYPVQDLCGGVDVGR